MRLTSVLLPIVHWMPCVQASTGRFWDLWGMFDMAGLSLQNIYLPAVLQQVGKVGLRSCYCACAGLAACACAHTFATVAGTRTAHTFPLHSPLLRSCWACSCWCALGRAWTSRLFNKTPPSASTSTKSSQPSVGAGRGAAQAGRDAAGGWQQHRRLQKQRRQQWQLSHHAVLTFLCSSLHPAPPAGISNMVTGAVGAGFTGSFIFSQTLFTGRAGVLSRLNGAGALEE